MNYRFVFKTLGKLLLIEAFLLLFPLVIAIYNNEKTLPFIFTIILLIILGSLFSLIKSKRKDYFAKEGLLITTLAWVLLSIFGALPFVLDGAIPNYIDALFETVSGFTTTGSSILTDIEALSKGLLFWRSFTHFIGGMGILVFAMAIIPMSNDNSMHMIKAEVPGPFPGKLLPRMSDTAKWLYGIYITLTLIEIILLCIGGMPLFDSIVTSFGTAGTGGFGIKNTSIAFYNSAYIEYIVGIFMLLFGINFNVFFFIIMKKFKLAFSNEEMKSYLIIIATSVILITLNILSICTNIAEAFRLSFFQVSTVITTTGFSTTDFNLWPTFSKMILFILMFFGACGGSTGGGIKISRIVILFKRLYYDIVALVHPRAVKTIKFENKKLNDKTVNAIGYYALLYIIIIAIITLLVSIDNFDFETTLTSVVSCISNIGPGLGLVGPTGNFSIFSNFSTILLTLAMLLGRLELYPLLLFLSPSFYEKNKNLNKHKKRLRNS